MDRQKKHKSSIGTQFNFISISMILITSICIVTFILKNQITQSYENLLSDGVSLGQMIAKNSEYAIYTEEDSSLLELIKSLDEDTDIEYVSIFNKENKVLLERYKNDVLEYPRTHRSQKDIETAKIAQKPFKEEGKKFVDLIIPVFSALDELSSLDDVVLNQDQQPIGFVQIGLSLKNLNQRTQKIIVYSLTLTLGIICISSLATLFITKRIVSPIISLANAAKEVSKGNFDHTIQVQSTNQIGTMADAFKQMVENLRVYREKDKQYQNTLEEEVNNRTLELNQALENANGLTREAQAANLAKSDFLANMSHELRTPLNHIIGFTELVVEKHFGNLNESQEEYLNDVLSSSRHLLSLINDVLDLSKVEAGKLELNCTPVDLQHLLQNSLIMVKEKALKHGLKVSCRFGELPGTIQADERKLKQVIYNLLANAVKFTPNGGDIVLSAELANGNSNGSETTHARPEESGPWVSISVRDTGIGLNQEDLRRIFNPFEQVESSRSRKFQGTGLGLSLVRNMVKLHGGKICVESDGEGKGCVFTIDIPANPQLAAQVS